VKWRALYANQAIIGREFNDSAATAGVVSDLKGVSLMKGFAAIALVVLAGACTASLQAQSHEVRADVPFNFAVGNKQLPAGHYTFFTDPSYTLVIRNIDYQFVALSRIEDAGRAIGNSNRLVFDKYGDHYFLREIRCPSIAMNVELRQSKLEKQIRVQRAGLGPETTLLALK
jgi:hypothetical protein